MPVSQEPFAMRALLSVSEKTGLVPLAQGLHRLGIELVASGGTAATLAAAGLPVIPVSDLTGYPDLLDGRVKTLHPAVHAPILARPTPAHRAELAAHGMKPIDLVVCNLYPFPRTVADPAVSEAAAVEHIDIGGVTLLRAAAKNYERVTVVVDPADYEPVLAALAAGGPSPEERRRLALKAFRHTAAYDAAIAAYLTRLVEGETTLPSVLNLVAERVQSLRYGENPHQAAAFYRWQGYEPAFIQLQGKELSYNNLGDLDGAWGAVGEFTTPAVAIIKHANPCGVATADDVVTAYRRAYACDPVSAFGSIIAVNRPVDLDLVAAIGSLFVEVLAAPAFTPAALAQLARKTNLRVMQHTGASGFPWRLVTVEGGLLVQTPDDRLLEACRVVTRRQPEEREMADLLFAWRVVKWVKSNAIVFAKDGATVGIGAGQMSRLDAVRYAGMKAGEAARGAVMASDAFFPFADGVEAAAEYGITAVIQPGGSIRDEEVIAAADRLGLAMVFTGMRHFRH
jgi:phosphoribosylaminoimidazolecarboxamide formyltransferase/IMP cyclohydrolase